MTDPAVERHGKAGAKGRPHLVEVMAGSSSKSRED